MLLIPISIFKYLRIARVGNLVLAIVRMLVQLFLIGLYLEFIFELDNIFLNLGWIFIMILITNYTVLTQSGLNKRKFILFVMPTYLVSLIVIFSSLLIVFDASTLFSAKYFIPISGMILGNILRGNVVALERFYSEIRDKYNDYIHLITLGATFYEAIKPFVRKAFTAAVGPQIASIATMGIVALPGMMTGQILGGISPIIAVKYQVILMVSIFVTMSISVFLSVYSSARVSFDEFGRIRDDIFIVGGGKKKKKKIK